MWLITFFTSRIGRLIGAVLAGAAAIAGVWAAARREGRQAAENEALRDSAERLERGRDAVADIDDTDADALLEQLRKNDGRW